MQEKILEIVKNACTEKGVALYDLELKPTGHGRVLLVYITRLGGVSINDCQSVSRMIEADLEAEDLIEGRYILEVSSPGLERDLSKKTHFVSAINEQIKLTVQGTEVNERIKGKLLEVHPDMILFETENEEVMEIPLNKIKKAKTLYDAKRDLKNAKQGKQKKEK